MKGINRLIRIKEEYFKNAYIFEKDLIKNFHLATGTHKTKKFVSQGDYEVSKVDSSIGVIYGFFATALDDEKKEIKIECLKLIKLIGKKYKLFAETSFKYIVEMINDEEDEVRYETVFCLEDLISNFKELDVWKY
jgi:hypothetical protein